MGIIDNYINKRADKKILEKFKNITKNIPDPLNLRSHIKAETLERISKDIGDWREAVENAEDIDNPDREELIMMYRDFVDDYQLFSTMQTRMLKSTSGSFKIMDSDGDIDEEETKKFLDPKGFPLPWFRKFMNIVMLSKFYGYEAIQLGDVIDNKFDWVEKFPEENLIPYYHAILLDYSSGFIKSNLIYIDEEPQSDWVIGVGSKTDLGLINKCAPYIIYKGVFGSWSEHADRFGMPVRVGSTDLRDNERRQNLINMFEAMTGSTYIVKDPSDEIELIEQKGGNDPHNIYGMLIEKCDQAISKIVLSQTGTTDEKAFAGSAGVHSSILNDVITADKLDISTIVNKELIPRMKKLGMISEGKDIYGQWDFSEQIDISKHVDNIQKLAQSGHFITNEEATKKTGYEFDDTIIPTPENKITSMMTKVHNEYKKEFKNG